MNQIFTTLREANIARLPQFKNCHGEPAHSKPDGSDWTPAEWLECVVGELGEYANKRKKYRRGDITKAEFDIEARKELADVAIYLDLLAFRLGIDLESAVISKFNEVSVRVGSDVRLESPANAVLRSISRVREMVAAGDATDYTDPRLSRPQDNTTTDLQRLREMASAGEPLIGELVCQRCHQMIDYKPCPRCGAKPERDRAAGESD